MIKCEICGKVLSLTSWNFNNSGEHRKTKDGNWVCSEKHLIEYNKSILRSGGFSNQSNTIIETLNRNFDTSSNVVSEPRDIEKEMELEKLKHQLDLERRERIRQEDKEFFEGIGRGINKVFSFVKNMFSKETRR